MPASTKNNNYNAGGGVEAPYMLSLLSPGAHSQNATQNKMINNSAHTVVNNQNSSSKLTYRKNVLYAGAAARGTQISQGAAASDSEPKK